MIEITNGMRISFQSKAPNDNNLYTGEVLGIVNSAVAANYSDIFTYHANVKSADNTIGSIETLSFVLLKTEPGTIIAMAKEWIIEETFKVITTSSIGTFEVQGVADETEAQNIISVLQAAGYSAKLRKLS